MVKSTVEISQNFVAFSEYMNFKYLRTSKFKACFMNDLYGIKGLGPESQKDKGQLFTVN